MGLIRRVVLEQLGGWDEWCITEDAELSLRLLQAGWTGLYVEESWGKGIMPLTFEALKGQRYRWCFGGIQLLRMHWRSLMPGRLSKRNRLTVGQRWSYLSGAVQWYGDLLGLVFLVYLLAGAANLAAGGGALFTKLSVFLVATVPVLVALGLVRAVRLHAPGGHPQAGPHIRRWNKRPPATATTAATPATGGTARAAARRPRRLCTRP